MSSPEPSAPPLFIDVAASANIPSERGLSVSAGGASIALFKVGEAVYAIEDSCPHAGSSLAGGRVSGCIVSCQSHRLRFDVRDGCMPGNSRLRVKVYATRVVDGRVSVSVGGEALPGGAG